MTGVRSPISDQLTLDFVGWDHFNFDAFEPGPNAVSLSQLRAVAEGRRENVVLSGPSGVGKTHLLVSLCAQAEQRGQPAVYAPLKALAEHGPKVIEPLHERAYVCLDDVDHVLGSPEWRAALFNLWNSCDAAGTVCVFSSVSSPANYNSGLPDLDSRLRSALSLALKPLDDEARANAMKRIADTYGFELTDEVVKFLLVRIPRDMTSLAMTVSAIDKRSLALKRRATLPLVRSWLETGLIP